ncbi:MAG: hypothetical protein JO041_01385 [Acidobacteria bacterium]|nr:hypothetical protein [Acidobacteriota bacterium]
MKSIILFVAVLFSAVLFSSALAAQEAPAAAPAGADDELFQATVANRVWTNTFLQISWTIPKGLYLRADQERAWKFKANPQGAHSYTDSLEKLDREARKNGVLLQGDNRDPETFGLAHSDVTDASGRFNVPAPFQQDAATRTFMILAHRVPTANATPAQLIQVAAGALRSQDPSLQVDVAAEPATIAGLLFASAEWKRRRNSQDQYYRSYLTVRKGYEVVFTFRAESKKALENIAKSLETITATPIQ